MKSLLKYLKTFATQIQLVAAATNVCPVYLCAPYLLTFAAHLGNRGGM